ncbi:MAG: POTRA domain-containing protein [Bacteroidia bacterium]
MTSKHLYVFLLVLVGLSATAQDILVSKITITGNTKTKEHVIRREILIQEDSAYTSTRLKDLIAQSENRVLNLNLFNTVNITRDTISDRDFIIKNTMGAEYTHRICRSKRSMVSDQK